MSAAKSLRQARQLGVHYCNLYTACLHRKRQAKVFAQRDCAEAGAEHDRWRTDGAVRRQHAAHAPARDLQAGDATARQDRGPSAPGGGDVRPRWRRWIGDIPIAGAVAGG